MAGIATYFVAVVLPALNPALFASLLSRGLEAWTVVTLMLVLLLILVQAPFAIVMLMLKHWKGASLAYLVSLGILAGMFALSPSRRAATWPSLQRLTLHQS
jgi:hypothetical protein